MWCSERLAQILRVKEPVCAHRGGVSRDSEALEGINGAFTEKAAQKASAPDGTVARTQPAASGDAPGARSWPSFWSVHSRPLFFWPAVEVSFEHATWDNEPLTVSSNKFSALLQNWSEPFLLRQCHKTSSGSWLCWPWRMPDRQHCSKVSAMLPRVCHCNLASPPAQMISTFAETVRTQVFEPSACRRCRGRDERAVHAEPAEVDQRGNALLFI